ncbi:acetyl-CoA carboxylase biotin carboxyl carrier protein subunit [Pelagibacteraceae bacterium]|jgi:acetyl-CoA carboxylase biotin carboxyl carrier protein|nr:acetyl-CoA carboxylase biotin carboxyl carrier protein subunit [Candidatus Pelagibacter sp.]MDC1485569.1 acetyl-CoA carboxylase biotin carboxyl carrier protein subunit [Pelagibacteraceae bacterium]|tara:strand:- start:514 stop:939 length:426 start_codon:yes stop_codon:yes gene_type:complete
MKIDKKLIKELTDYLNEFGLTELEYGNNETKIKVSKSNSLISSVRSENIDLKPSTESKKNQPFLGQKITSPIIGTAYLSPEPGTKKFIEVGKKIRKGDTVMIVEAMKTMNHVPATSDGIVKEVCVEDGSPVEFGQTIVILE